MQLSDGEGEISFNTQMALAIDIKFVDYKCITRHISPRSSALSSDGIDM